MGFTIDEVMEVIQIVKECKDTELHIDTGEIKLSLFKGEVGDSDRRALNFPGAICQPVQAQAKTEAATAPATPAASEVSTPIPTPSVSTEAKDEELSEEGLVPIKANVTSVFYRRPSPSEPPFVEVGDSVKEDTVLCLLEVMKCFRQVLAEMRGRIEKICVESNSLVEQGSTLFLIRPE
jgi:acetyl-CoA carboxylase biotin carboxyl carrier protein